LVPTDALMQVLSFINNLFSLTAYSNSNSTQSQPSTKIAAKAPSQTKADQQFNEAIASV